MNSSKNFSNISAAQYFLMDKKFSLTVIIPVRITEQRRDILDRLSFYEADSELPDGVDFLIVDDGSKDSDYIELQRITSDRVKVIRTGAQYYQDFSLARARNFGAQRASGDFIMFLDADLIPYPGFYKDLLIEINALNIEQHVNRFLMVPVIYLTEFGYEIMKNIDGEYWRTTFINAKNSLNTDVIEKHSSGTSVIVVEKYYYLSRGGQDEDFQGWGYEDYEFTNRLIRRLRMFPLPKNWLSNAGNFITINAFDGWKACYRLYGDWLAAKGIYLFHAPHPIESSYHSRKGQNERFLAEKMKADSIAPSEPDALPSLSAGTSLIFRQNPFCWNREFAPFLGEPLFMHEDSFTSISHFADFVRDSFISRVIFPNPYANATLLSFYKWCRKNDFPYIVCERGALPDSIYHDRNGFLVDSTSYNKELWDKDLSDEQRDRTLLYISEIRFGSETLEKQANRSDIVEVKKRLGLKSGQKVLLVPFQQPHDTVTKFFSGSAGSVESFRNKIERIASRLDDSWKVVYKMHPAEVDFLPIPGAISAHNEHIYDLLEIASAVTVINSGVGIYAMMFGKPLFVFGECWYLHDGICFKVEDEENLIEGINSNPSIDYEKVIKFIHYLRFEFYSFGRMTSRRVMTPEGTPITATTDIDYYEIRGWGHSSRHLERFKTIPFNSPIFDRYKGRALPAPKSSDQNHPKPSETKTENPKPSETKTEKGLSEQTSDSRSVIANLVSNGRFYEAAESVDREFRRDSSKPNLLRVAAELYLRAGDKKSALRKLAEAKSLMPDNKALDRRIRVVRRPWLKRFIGENPFPIDIG